jgi:hypothetical protein
LLDDRRIRIREAQKPVDPDSDPDPQHWFMGGNIDAVFLSVLYIQKLKELIAYY